ncbi:MAG: hypothetical protein EOO62_07180 [Hymenobacter sp.]|nr:MAG: hypothetical protein EOO62_07180 [Hymenobacter sp.]
MCRWLRLKTEVLAGRERPVFADLSTPKPAWPTILTTTITSASTLALIIRPPITHLNSFFDSVL